MIKHRLLAIAAIVLLVIIITGLWLFPPAEYIDHKRIEALIDRHRVLGLAVFFVVAALFTAVGMPRQLVAFSAGYIWGVIGGLVISTISAIVGCAITFYVSRALLSPFAATRFKRLVSVINGFVERDVFIKIIILRLQPFGTNLATNLSAGVSNIPAKIFLPGSFLGYLPQMLVFAIGGSGIRVGSKEQMLISVLLFVFSLFLGAYLFRKGTLFK